MEALTIPDSNPKPCCKYISPSTPADSDVLVVVGLDPVLWGRGKLQLSPWPTMGRKRRFWDCSSMDKHWEQLCSTKRNNPALLDLQLI